MPSKTFIVRAHARTIYTKPITFVCAKCHQATTRECYPGYPPKYCLNCAPKKKSSDTSKPEKGMFHPTHCLIASSGKTTEVCLEKSSEPGWYWVRTALDWFSGESIIQYHPKLGLQSRGVTLVGYSLETLAGRPVAGELSDTLTGEPKDALTFGHSDTETVKTTGSETSIQPHGLKQLCKRFRCGEALLKKMRSSPDFGQWSQSRDPQALSWEYRDGKFFPVVQAVSK